MYFKHQDVHAFQVNCGNARFFIGFLDYANNTDMEYIMIGAICGAALAFIVGLIVVILCCVRKRRNQGSTDQRADSAGTVDKQTNIDYDMAEYSNIGLGISADNNEVNPNIKRWSFPKIR